ncbi:hypothetical protein APHAL10511_003976 [Amanita phalloides]|nr:hypothetical protein APHAL10511_003976 [Amanita phalloides]
MGKLNIAHHKSYHPYRRDNIERVRHDEEQERLKEAQQEGRIMLADSEARIDLLRQRAGMSRRQQDREEQRMLEERTPLAVTSHTAPLPTTDGHINFFQDLEQTELVKTIKTTKTPAAAANDKGVALAPSKEDLRPWYSSRKGEPDTGSRHGYRNRRGDDPDGNEMRLRDAARKSVEDPLTAINRHLISSRDRQNEHEQDWRFKRPEPPTRSKQPSSKDDVQARLARESSERERALALIRRKKREMSGSETPSTVHGGDLTTDMFNREDVEEARRRREKEWGRRSGRQW